MELVVQGAYLGASVLFILAIKLLASPRTARLGNLLGALGMLVGTVGALLQREVVRYEWIVVGLVVGSVAGVWLALKVPMTAMPQAVALFDFFGGAAAVFVVGGQVAHACAAGLYEAFSPWAYFAIGSSLLIGGLTLTGGLVAFAKLQEWITGRPILLVGHHYQSLALFLFSLVALGWSLMGSIEALWLLTGLALWLGVWITLPVGGADMPVVLAFLTSLSGLTATAAGFALDKNVLLIVAGTLVGASGFILTLVMARGMNRSLWNVLFGAMGAQVEADVGKEKTIRSTTAQDVALMLAYAREVVIIPGYGMAVAQAQHAAKKLTDALEKRGVSVRFAIHPVAGRMPGHMNVLLAEADIPYDKLYEMERINPDMPQVDVALVVGANDVVNPAARSDPNSPLYGMPIIDADKARTVVVFKRSMNPGFAGVDNVLFYQPNTYMLFGDARISLEAIVEALKSV